MRRTSNQPGWQIENGRRLSVFCFFGAQPRLRPHRRQSLAKQILRPRFRQKFRTRHHPIHHQPRNRLQAPSHIELLNFRLHQTRIHLAAGIRARRQKLHPPSHLPNPSHQLHPPPKTHLRDPKAHPRRHPRVHHPHTLVIAFSVPTRGCSLRFPQRLCVSAGEYLPPPIQTQPPPHHPQSPAPATP